MAEVDGRDQGRPERRRAQEGLTRRHVITGLTFTAWALSFGQVQARDFGQWKDTDPEVSEWYRSLMRPNVVPLQSCCGKADAYWAEVIEVRDGKVYATITDDRDDKPLGRPHVDVGTKIEIPDHTLKWDRSNPTGHVILFMTGAREVLCFVQNGGV